MPHPLALYAPSPYAGTLGLGPCSLQAPPCVYYCPLPPEGYAKALMAYAETGDRADSGHGHEPAMAESLPPNATRVPLYPRSPFPLPLPAPFPRRASARMARSQRTGGSYDPSQFEIFPERAAADGRTTVMLRNVPNRYSQRFLMDHLRGRGLADRFDFVYLPIDFRSRCNLGYAFVNLMTPADVAQLHAAYQNHLWESGCSKVCCASYARIQGREALICHFLDARFALDDPEVMPVVFARTEGGKAFDPVSVQNYIARRQLAVGATEGGDAPAAGRSEEGAQGDVPGGTGDPARSDAEAAGAAEQPSAPPRGDSDSASGRSAEDELHEDCAPRPPSPFATDAPFRGTEVTSNSDSLADTFALPTSLSDALVLEDVSDDADDPPGSSAARRKESQPCHDSASSVHGEALDSHSLPKLSSATPA